MCLYVDSGFNFNVYSDKIHSLGIICETLIDVQEKRRSYCIEVHELMQDMKGHVEPITGEALAIVVQ